MTEKKGLRPVDSRAIEARGFRKVYGDLVAVENVSFEVWLYPLPAFISLAGYIFVFSTLGLRFILFGILTLLLGAVVYLVMARRQGEWPFAEVDEATPSGS